MTYSLAKDAKLFEAQGQRLKAFVLSCLKPPPKIKPSDWAALNLPLSQSESPEPGLWRPYRAPFQIEMMDSLIDPGVTKSIIVSSSQIGKTTIMKALLGYFMDLDPCPMMYLMPTVILAEGFSKERIKPMLTESPGLKRLFAEGIEDRRNTILEKYFPGGFLVLAGANSAASLASRPIRILLRDEVDRYPLSAGSEGDPSRLASTRTTNFWNRKDIAASTPGEESTSRIWFEYQQSDRRRWFVTCPDCLHVYTFEWEQMVYDEKDLTTARLSCPACGVLHDDKARHQMIQKGQWIPTHPQGHYPGFHISQLYSPWVRLAEIVDKYLEARGKPELIQVFQNTVLGLPYAENKEGSNAESLFNRREIYDEHAIPSSVLLLVAGVDIQDDRFEIEVLGIGAGEECWSVAYIVINEAPTNAEAWRSLDDLLLRFWKTEDKRDLRIKAACIDSGGHHTEAVYRFCEVKARRCVWAIKGRNGPLPIWPLRASRSRTYKGFTVRTIGVDTAKDLIFARLKNEIVGPGYCHFPINYEMDYFLQLTAETRQTTYTKSGQLVKKWVKHRDKRNEALDCRVYAWAAFNGLINERRLKLSLFVPQSSPIQKTEDSNSQTVKSTPTFKKRPHKIPKSSPYLN